MGCLCDRNAEIPSQGVLSQEEKGEQKYKKLLLLGAGWSGKSTVFKQMKLCYGNGYSESERKSLRWTIHQNTYQAMKTLCEENKNEKYGKNDPQFQKQYEAVRLFDDETSENCVNKNLWNNINDLWKTSGIKKTYEHRDEFFLANGEVDHFFNNIDTITKEEYLPTEEDILKCRCISMGVRREVFKVDGVDCELFDVGGQKSERKKWVNCFENVFIVLFVVAISEYDQVMYEDTSTNRVMDALDLFESICNSKWFCRTNVVLLLNKKDVFAEKVVKIPLKKYFPEFQPTCDDSSTLAQESEDYLKQLFLDRNHQKRSIKCEVTCATSIDDIRKTFTQSVSKIFENQMP